MAKWASRSLFPENLPQAFGVYGLVFWVSGLVFGWVSGLVYWVSQLVFPFGSTFQEIYSIHLNKRNGKKQAHAHVLVFGKR